MDVRKTLERLCLVNGPSGFEQNVADAAERLLRPLTDETYRTALGSVVGVRRSGAPGAKRLLLDAHMDEVGAIVTGHKEGFLRFRPLGGVDPRMLCDREMLLLTEPERLAVTACLPPHVQSGKDEDEASPVDKIYLDAGLAPEEAERLVPVGTPAVYRGGFAALGGDLISAKALDDRACMVAILRALELMGDKLAWDVYVLFSTQEETTSVGAITAASEIAPHACIAVDVTHAVTPDAPKDGCFKLGGGPTVGIGPNADRRMAAQFLALAEKLHIPVQTEVMAGHSGTNAWPVQICREGIVTSVLSLPLRYMHTPIETISLSDLDATARLLSAYVTRAGEVTARA